MKKLSTHIKGLDALFLGGIQVTSVTDPPLSSSKSDNRDNDSLVVIIRGCRGSNKHLFAMQLMHGLGMSIFDHQRTVEQLGFKRENCKELRFYSINKPTHLLEDMYLDLIIQRWISHTNIEYKGLSFGDSGKSFEEARDELNEKTKEVFDILFKVGSPSKVARRIYDEKFSDHITDYLAKNIIGYNARTNSIHLRTGNVNDDSDNFLFRRRYESVRQYFDKPNADKIRNLSEQTDNDYYGFKSEFLNASFNPHNSSSDSSLDSIMENGSTIRKADSARSSFFSILNDIEEDVDKENLDEEVNGNKDKSLKPDNPFPCEVVVIDGFSHISEKDLQSLPYPHLIACLRKLARISILVFEDTQITMPDGDIEIEIRATSDEVEEYAYNEIRISKCVNQVTALGWHLYTRQESQIQIYPSILLRLFKRSYINNQMHDLGRSILDDSYEMFLDNMPVKESNLRRAINNMQEFCNKEGERFSNQMENLISSAFLSEQTWKDDEKKDVLDKILQGKWQQENLKSKLENQRLHNHCPITTIVGNPNSHKRELAMCRIFSLDEVNTEAGHVLVLLLDKDPEEMRKKFVCPGMYEKFSKVEPNFKDEDIKAKKEQCSYCYKRISFLNVNPGCITPQEFLSMLNDQIEVYLGQYKKNSPMRPLQILLDDYHRIDFNFPFLSASNLFTSALISLCQVHNVGLTILCDKSSKRVREVCTLSDYVLSVERNEGDVPNKITVYTEKTGDEIHASSILRFRLDNIKHLMKCDEREDSRHNGLELDKSKINDLDEVGSVKEYWRATTNTVNTKRALKESVVAGNQKEVEDVIDNDSANNVSEQNKGVVPE